MSGQESAAPAAATEPTSLPERSANPAGDAGAPQPAEISKNAAKKAAKKEKLAQGKAGKADKADKGIGHSGTKHAAVKPAKKKGDGPALIGIDVAKEDDFAAWYQQVLLKGEMLDYYDVSGCFVLKVCWVLLLQFGLQAGESQQVTNYGYSLTPFSYGNRSRAGLMPK